MITTIEGTIMVSPVNDSSNLKKFDPNSRLSSKKSEENKTEISETPAQPEAVNLSFESKQLEALKASLQNTPEVNKTLVEFFKAEIESGKYKINSDKIAFNMLNTLEMA